MEPKNTPDDENMVRDGDLLIEERMNRRDGLVQYEGTVGAGDSGRKRNRRHRRRDAD